MKENKMNWHKVSWAAFIIIQVPPTDRAEGGIVFTLEKQRRGRGGSISKTFWKLVGGGKKPEDKAPLDTVFREIKEETKGLFNLIFKNKSKIREVDRQDRGGKKNKKRFIFTFYILLNKEPVLMSPGLDAEDVEIFNIDNVMRGENGDSILSDQQQLIIELVEKGIIKK